MTYIQLTSNYKFTFLLIHFIPFILNNHSAKIMGLFIFILFSFLSKYILTYSEL